MHLSATAQSGYKIQPGLDVLHGDAETSLRIQVAYIYRLAPNFWAELGTSYTHYDDPLSLVPLFFGLKYPLGKGDIVPFLFIRGGYSFSILTDTDVRVDSHEGGGLFNPGLGIQLATKSGTAFYFSAGYNVDHSTFKNETGTSRTVKTDVTYKRLMVGVGFLF